LGYSTKYKELIYISGVISASLENYISYLVLVHFIIENAKDIKMLYDKININIMKYIFWILTVLEEGSNDIKKAIDSKDKNIHMTNIQVWYDKFIETIEKNYHYTHTDECKYKDNNTKTISEHEECNTYGIVIRRRCDRLKYKVENGVTLPDRLKTSAKKTLRPSSQLYSELIREYVILSATVTMLQGQMEIYKVLHEVDYTTGVKNYVKQIEAAEAAKKEFAKKEALAKKELAEEVVEEEEVVGGGKKSRHNRKSNKSKKNKRRSSMHSRNKNA
jgi:hypothetical protein